MDKRPDYNKFWSPAFDTMEDFVFLIDKDFHVVRVNNSFLKFTKGRPEDFIGKACYEIIHETDAPFSECPHARMIASGHFEHSEFFEPRLKKWLYVRTTPIFDDDNKLIGSIHMAADVTAMRESGAERQKALDEANLILDSVPASVFYKNTENVLIRVNETFSEAMSIPKDKLNGRSLFDIFPKEQAQKYWDDDMEVIRSGKPKKNIVEPMDTKIGRLWVRTDKVPYRNSSGKIIGIIGFSVDITNLKRTEEALARSEKFLNEIIDSVADPVFVKDRDHRWILINKAFALFMGRDRDDIIGKSDYDFFPESEAEVFWRMDKEVLDTGIEKINEEKFTDSKNITHIIITKKTLYRSLEGNEFIVGIIRDMTEYRKMKETIKDDEKKYRALYDSSVDAIMLLDPKKGFINGNAATIKLFGFEDESDFISITPADLSPEYQPNGEPSGSESEKMMDKALRDGFCSFEWLHRRRDGTEFYASVLLNRIEINKDSILQATVRDITKEKKLSSELDKRIKSLEQFQKITIDREIKMKELKAKIKELEAKIQKGG